MDLDQIDGLLQRYSAAESRIGANLQELDNHSTYQVLKTDVLRGRTAAKIGPAFAKADTLWKYYMLLQTTLTQCRTLRGAGKLRGNEKSELVRILTTPSIILSTIEVPLEERGAFEAASSDERVTIEQLLTRMRTLYEPIRDGVAEAERIHRDVLPRLNAAETTLNGAKAAAAELGMVEPELTEAVRQLERLRTLSFDDPLAVDMGSADALERQVRLAAGRVASLKKGRDRLGGDLGAMAGLVAEIRTLRVRAESARHETLEKITSPTGLVRVPPEAAIDGPGGLQADSAAILDSNAPWHRQRQELDAWLEKARRLRDQLRRAEQRNRRDLTRRDELRGLLRAYRAKMAGVGKAEDVVLREIADEAHNELFTSPTNLARAEKIVQDLGASLSGG